MKIFTAIKTMRPSSRLIKVILALLAFSIFVFCVRMYGYFQLEDVSSGADITLLSSSTSLFASLWRIALYTLLIIIFIDAFRRRNFSELGFKRRLPHTLALGVHSDVEITLSNPYSYPLGISFIDCYPQQIRVESLPADFILSAKSSKTINYSVYPIKRGDAVFSQGLLRITSAWSFWQFSQFIGENTHVKIYPNFAPIAHFASIGLEKQIAQLGIHLQQRRGEGSDFNQLRDFREGDVMRQIDWKATARYRKPISREYQDERDQEIFFLLDCGRRMRNKDGDISHFDHALNALLLTAYVALRQGDSVGLISFAGEERWIKPVKGSHKINTFLNQLYDLHSTTATTDYLQVAENFLKRNNKRSLVVLISNIQQSDASDLNAAVRLLRKKHLVLVASIRDDFLDSSVDASINNINDALSYCGTKLFVEERKQLLAQLQNAGVIMTDSLASELHINLVNEYLKAKRSNRL